MSSFVHLHTHSHYSLLEALPKIKDLILHVKALGMDAVALTDNGALYGAIEFYEKARDAGIKPIIGMDAYVAREGRHLKRARIDTKPHRLVLLAENEEGYRNLIALSSIGFLEGFYYKPRIDNEVLRAHARGLIALSGGYRGEIDEVLRSEGAERAERAEKLVQEYVDIFGEGNFYLELVDRPEIAEQESTNARLIELSRALSVPLVATKNTFYLKPDDVEAWKILNCIKGGKTIEQFDRQNQFDFDASMVSGEYMEDRFADVPEAIENTRAIAERCTLTLELGQWNFPKFEIPEGQTFREVLSERAYRQLEEKEGPLTEQMKDRLEYELEIIDNKGFCPYFMIVSDFISWSRQEGIMTTTRGSVAGSLVGYSIGISAINPLTYELPFERFLNPERPSAPDVDADFADNRRDEVLDYVRAKYGHEKVAQICTFGTMLARGSVRDVGRALGFPYAMVDEVAKLVPMGSQGFPMTLERALGEAPDLKKKYDTDANVRRMIDLARRIEGCARHVSIHAAGTVISPTALTDFTPLQIDTKEGKVITQYEMKSVEKAGLIKMDFLGIRNLSILGDAVALVRRLKGIALDIERIPVDDKKTFELLAKGYTMGTFQLNGDGMTKYLMDLRPERVEDIMAMVALYRPGPIESIPEYIRRKHDASLVSYLDPRMTDILNKSYGVIVYQDDVMLIAIHLAGYSWLEADKLRKAMGKKIPEEMAKQKIKLLEGFVANGLSDAKARELWKLIEPFAAYGFNKCLAGDVRVLNPVNGSYFTIKELFDRQDTAEVLSMQPNFQLKTASRSRIVENGRKKIYKLKTRSGRQIRATANHPFFVFAQWKQLDHLVVGDRIAVPRRLPAGPGVGIDHRRLKVLGYLIAEGNLCHPHGVYYYSKDQSELLDFVSCLDAFDNVKVKFNTSKSATSVYVGQQDQKNGNELYRWLDEMDLIGKRATEKTLPTIISQLDEEELSVLLAGMWQGDGCISDRGDGMMHYATSSRELSRQVQHYLLRLGILSTIHDKSFKYRGTIRQGYAIHISKKENIEQFDKTIGRYLLPNKQLPLSRILARLGLAYLACDGLVARGTKDIVPVAIRPFIKAELQLQNVRTRDIAAELGISPRIFWPDARRVGYTHKTIQWIGEYLRSPFFLSVANSDIYWDEVVSIEPDGIEMTYDLEVPEKQNFVANDVIVHNSHAASYGMVAYQTAFMKANFPAEYMTALMTAESGDLEKIAEAVHECERMGIKVSPPDINESLRDFTYISDTEIRFGLLVVKNLGAEVVESMIAERKQHGLFKDLSDFASRVSHHAFNKKSLEALIKSGALDRFGERKQLLENTDRILLHNKHAAREKATNQQSLFSAAPSVMTSAIALRPCEPAVMRELLLWEKELLGLYISAHPFEPAQAALKGLVTPLGDVARVRDGKFVKLAGMIANVHEIVTRKGDPMAFVTLEDADASFEVVVFPETFAKSRALLKPDRMVLVSAKVSRRDGEVGAIVNSFLEFEDGEERKMAEMLKSGRWGEEGGDGDRRGPMTPPSDEKILHHGALSIALKGRPTPEMVERLREILRSSPGPKPVCLLVDSGGRMRQIETDYSVTVSDLMIDEIAALVGRQNVQVL